MLGEKIKTLRKQNKLTQIQLANKLGIKQPSLNNWESGKINPSLKMLKKLSSIFDVAIDTLVFDEKDIKNLKDKNIISQISGFSNLDDESKQTILNMINVLSKKKNN